MAWVAFFSVTPHCARRKVSRSRARSFANAQGGGSRGPSILHRRRGGTCVQVIRQQLVREWVLRRNLCGLIQTVSGCKLAWQWLGFWLRAQGWRGAQAGTRTSCQTACAAVRVASDLCSKEAQSHLGARRRKNHKVKSPASGDGTPGNETRLRK